MLPGDGGSAIAAYRSPAGRRKRFGRLEPVDAAARVPSPGREIPTGSSTVNPPDVHRVPGDRRISRG